VAVSTINKIGEDYDTLTLWEDDVDGNLVGDTRQETAACYDDDGYLADELVVDDSTTNDTYYMKVTVPEGERHDGTMPDGTAGDGFRICNFDWGHHAIYVADDYTIIEYVAVNEEDTDGNSVRFHSCSYAVIRYCIIELYVGIELKEGVQYPKVYNNLVQNCRNMGIYCYGFSGARDAYVYNNTVVDASSYGIREVAMTTHAKNNIVQGSPSNNAYTGDFESDSTNNIGEKAASELCFGATADSGTTDGASSGKLIDSDQDFLSTCKVGYVIKNTTDNTYTYITAIDSDGQLSVNDDIFADSEDYTIYKNFFGSVTFENEESDDFHLGATDTLAKDNGVSLSGIFTDDIDGDTRSGAWDIGADEYVAEEEALTISTSESISITENVTLEITPLKCSVYESVTVAEKINRDRVCDLAVYDSVTLAESITKCISLILDIADTISASEHTAYILICNLSNSESISITEDAALLLPSLNISIYETITISDEEDEAIPALYKAVSDSVTIAESASFLFSHWNLSIYDSVTMAEYVSRLISHWNLSLSNTVTISEYSSFLFSHYNIISFDSITIVEASSFLLSHYNLAVSESVSVAEDVTNDLSALGLSVSVSDSINISENITAERRFKVTTIYYFNSMDVGVDVTWETNPEKMIDGNYETTASTVTDGDIEALIGNTCPGTDLGNIIKMEVRAYGNSSTSNNVYLRPVFGGGDGDNHNTHLGDSGEWSDWFPITNDTNAPSTWSWSNVKDLDLDVEFEKNEIGGASIGIVQIRVTYTILAVTINVNEPITVNEDTSRNLICNLSLSESISITEDAALLLLSLNVSISETISISDEESESMPVLHTAVYDSITIAESSAFLLSHYNLSLFDTVSTAESSAGLLPILYLGVYDSISIAENVTVQVSALETLEINAADSISVAESITQKTVCIVKATDNIFSERDVAYKGISLPDSAATPDVWDKGGTYLQYTDVTVQNDTEALNGRSLELTADEGKSGTLNYKHDESGEYWYDNVSNAKGHIIEFRIKVISDWSGVSEENQVSYVYAADGAWAYQIGLKKSKIVVLGTYISESAKHYDIDLTDGYHIIKSVVIGTSLKVYVDGTLGITATLDYSSGGTKRLLFQVGGSSTSDAGVIRYDYLNYLTGSPVRLNKVLYLEVNDTVTIAEYTKRSLVCYSENFDTITLTEAYDSTIVNQTENYDSITVTEDVTVEVKIWEITPFESISITEEINLAIIINLSVNELITIAEDIAINLICNLNLYDNISTVDEEEELISELLLSVSDSLIIAEYNKRNMQLLYNASDVISVTDEEIETMLLLISADDDISIDEYSLMYRFLIQYDFVNLT